MPRGNRIRPTSFGIWFIVMTLVIGLAAVNTGNNLLILNFSLMLSTLLVSGIVSRAAMRRLTMTRRTPSTIYAGTPFTEAVTVSNRKRLYPSVSLRIRTAIATSSVHVSYVPPRGTRTFILEGLYPRRGRFKLEQLELSSLYPFGFFERHRLQMNDETVTVFPHVERILPFFRSAVAERETMHHFLKEREKIFTRSGNTLRAKIRD